MEQLDPQAVNLAKAIRQRESNGDFNVKGKSGEWGAYQYTKPTWDEDVRRFGLNYEYGKATPEQQNEVAYKKIKSLKDSGYNVGQIASIWNSGQPEWEGKRGVNKYGVQYDVPEYVNSVAQTYQQLKQGQQPQQQVQQPESQGFLKTLISDPLKTLLVKPADRFAELIGRTGMLGENIKKGYEEMADTGQGRQFAGIDVEAQKAGTEGLKQAGGEALKTASYLYTGGQAPSLAGKGLVSAVKTSALSGAKVGAIGGGLYGAGEGIQEGNMLGKGLAGAALGGVGGAVLGGAMPLAFKSLRQPTQEMFDASVGQIADEYRKVLPLTPTQRAYEARALQRTGDDVFTTLAKNGINVGSDDAVRQIDDISEQFRRVTTEAQKNERALFNLDEVINNAYKSIDEQLSSELERNVAKTRLNKEISSIMTSNKLQKGAGGEVLVNSDLIERLRKTGNGWAQYNKFNPNTTKNASGRALADAVRDQVEKQGTFPGYREANKEWSKIIRAQQLLGEMENQGKQLKLPGGLSGSIARKILSGALGLQSGGIGGMILADMGSDYAYRILANPEWRTYLNRKVVEKFGNKTPSQQAIKKLSQEIMEYVEKQSSLKRLPAPSYIPLGPRTGESGVKLIEAQKNPVSANPKTGKFQTSYSSDPYRNQAFGAVAGIERDEEGNIKFNPEKAAMGIAGMTVAKSKLGQKVGKGLVDISKKGVSSLTKDIPPVYKGEKDLTTKILKDLEGKTTVSKQYILDATNRPELKQTERDLIRQALEGEGNTVNVNDFAKKVKAELLPLKVKTTSNPKGSDAKYFREQTRGDAQYAGARMQPRYEMVNLPDELRGSVKNYRENIYESPIKTSAGEIHFGGKTDNYFGHTRIEDMADNKTRRVIEVQSDLYQKGNLEREFVTDFNVTSSKIESIKKEMAENAKLIKEYNSPAKYNAREAEKISKRSMELEQELSVARQEATPANKLRQYNDPTAHFRMVREEIKKASQDGKTKLQFPTGETAMKIEGLGQGDNHWAYTDRTGKYVEDFYLNDAINQGDKSVIGMEARRVVGADNWSSLDGEDWIITDVLGDGKFKAVPKSTHDNFMQLGGIKDPIAKRNYEANAETFDISGKVDTNNPIYKFYEKDVAKYLNKFGGKRVVDDKGVSWIEVPITKEQGKMPIEAFGIVGLMGTSIPRVKPSDDKTSD